MEKNYEQKTKLISLIVGVLVLALLAASAIHTPITDRINPLVHEQVGYAKVVKGQNKYQNVKIYDSETKKPLSYTIKEITGYDPTGQYLMITHKGQYVESIKYLSEKEFSQAIN